MEFNELIAELRASSENLPNESADRSLLSSVYCNKACKAIDKIAENQEYDNVITGLWLIVAHFAEQLRYLKPVPALSELCFKLFRQCAKSVLNIQWQNLEEDSSVRQNFLISLANLHAKLIPFDFPRFRLLEALTESPWTNPTLAKVMGGEIEDADKEEVRSYIEQEDPIILQLRVDMMLKENCEEYALNLCNSCLTHPELQTDLSIRKIQLSLLYKLGHEDKLQEECQKLSIHDALRIIKQLQTSEPHRQLCTVLAQTFMVQNWIRPSDMEANKELLRLWIRQQLLVDREQDRFKDSVWAMAKLSQSTEQIVIFIDVLREECGDIYLQLYMDMCVFAINVDKGQMETSIKENNLVAAVARRSDMASVCAKLSCLCHHTSLKVARICALTSFALKPSEQSFTKIGTFYGQGGGCCKKCGMEKNHEPGKINPATLYEVERLLNMLRPDYLNPDNPYVTIQALCRRFLHESLKNAEQRKQQECVVSAHQTDGVKRLSPNKPTNLFEALLPQDVQNTQLLLNRMRLQNIPMLQSSTPIQTSQITGSNRPNILIHHAGAAKQQYIFDAEKIKSSLPYGVPLDQQHQYFLNKHEKELEQRRKNSQKKKDMKVQESLVNPQYQQQNMGQVNQANCKKLAPQSQQQMSTLQVTQLIQSALQKDSGALQKLTQSASPEVVRAVLDIMKSNSLKTVSSVQQSRPLQQMTGPSQQTSQPLPTVSTLLKPAGQQQQLQSDQKREQPTPRRYPRPQLYAQPIIVSTAPNVSSSSPRPQLANTSMASARNFNSPASLNVNVISTMTPGQKQKAESLLQSKNQAESIRQFMQLQMSNQPQKQISEMRQMSGSTITVNSVPTSSSSVNLMPRTKTTVELAEEAALAKQQGKALAFQQNQSQGYVSHLNQHINKTVSPQFAANALLINSSQSQKQQHQQNNTGFSLSSFNPSSAVPLPSSDELSGSIMGIDDTIIKELLQDSGILANTFPDIEVDTVGEDKSRKISDLTLSSQQNVSLPLYDSTRRVYTVTASSDSLQSNVSLLKQSLPISSHTIVQPNQRENYINTSQPSNVYSQHSVSANKNQNLAPSSDFLLANSKISIQYAGSSVVPNNSSQVRIQIPSNLQQFTEAQLSIQPRENVNMLVSLKQEDIKPTVDQLREQMKKEHIEGEIYMDSANNATYRCIICSLAFETLDNLREHVRNVCKPGLQSSSVYNTKIKQDRANSAKAGLETTTVFQCLRCFELCVSDAGIKQHRLTCKRVPTVPSDLKKEAPYRGKVANKSGKTTPKGEMKDNSYVVPEMPLPFPYPSLNTEAVFKSLAIAGKSTIATLNNGENKSQTSAFPSKPQITITHSTGIPVNSLNSISTSTSGLLSSQPSYLAQSSKPQSSHSMSVYSPGVSSITSSLVTTVASSSSLINVSNSRTLNVNLNAASVSSTGMPYVNNTNTASISRPNDVLIKDNALSVDSHSVFITSCQRTVANDTNTVSSAQSVALNTGFSKLPDVNNAFSSDNITSLSCGQNVCSFPAQHQKDDKSLSISQPASVIEAVSQEQKETLPVLPKKVRKRQPKKLPAPSFTEISGSGGSKFFKCNLCSQTLCSLESFVVHWEECATKNKALLRRRASRDKLLNAKPLTEEMVKNLKDVIASVAAGGGAMDAVHFDDRDLNETELLLLEDPCDEENNKPDPSNPGISESDPEELNSLISRRSDEDNFSEATTEKDSEDDVRFRNRRRSCDSKNDDTSNKNAHLKMRERRSSKTCSDSVDRQEEMDETEGEKTPSSASEVESEGSSLFCKLCKTSYQNKRMLLQHFAGKHLKPYTVKSATDSTSYICHLCQKTFPIFMHYMQHVPDHSVTIYEKMRSFVARTRISHKNCIIKKNSSYLVKALKSKRAAKKSALDKLKRELLSSNTEEIREKLSLSKKKKSKGFTSSEDDYSSDISKNYEAPSKNISECSTDATMLNIAPKRGRGRPRKQESTDEASSSERSSSKLSSNKDEDFLMSDDTDSDYTEPPTTRSKKGNLSKRIKQSSESECLSDSTNPLRHSKRRSVKSPDVSGYESDSSSVTLTFVEHSNGSLQVVSDLASSGLNKTNIIVNLDAREQSAHTITVRSLSKQQMEKLKSCDLNPTIVLKNLTPEDVKNSTDDIKSKASIQTEDFQSTFTTDASAENANTPKSSSFFDSYLSYLNRYPKTSEKIASEPVAPRSNSSIDSNMATGEVGCIVDTDGSTISYGTSTDKEDSLDTSSASPTSGHSKSAEVKMILAKYPTRRCSVNLGKKVDQNRLHQSSEANISQEDVVNKLGGTKSKDFLHSIQLADNVLKQDPAVEPSGVVKISDCELPVQLNSSSEARLSEEIVSPIKENLAEDCDSFSVESGVLLSVENIDAPDVISVSSKETLVGSCLSPISVSSGNVGIEQYDFPKDAIDTSDKKDGVLIEVNSENEDIEESEDYYIVKESSDPEMDETEGSTDELSVVLEESQTDISSTVTIEKEESKQGTAAVISDNLNTSEIFNGQDSPQNIQPEKSLEVKDLNVIEIPHSNQQDNIIGFPDSDAAPKQNVHPSDNSNHQGMSPAFENSFTSEIQPVSEDITQVGIIVGGTHASEVSFVQESSECLQEEAPTINNSNASEALLVQESYINVVLPEDKPNLNKSDASEVNITQESSENDSQTEKEALVDRINTLEHVSLENQNENRLSDEDSEQFFPADISSKKTIIKTDSNETITSTIGIMCSESLSPQTDMANAQRFWHFESSVSSVSEDKPMNNLHSDQTVILDEFKSPDSISNSLLNLNPTTDGQCCQTEILQPVEVNEEKALKRIDDINQNSDNNETEDGILKEQLVKGTEMRSDEKMTVDETSLEKIEYDKGIVRMELTIEVVERMENSSDVNDLECNQVQQALVDHHDNRASQQSLSQSETVTHESGLYSELCQAETVCSIEQRNIIPPGHTKLSSTQSSELQTTQDEPMAAALDSIENICETSESPLDSCTTHTPSFVDTAAEAEDANVILSKSGIKPRRKSKSNVRDPRFSLAAFIAQRLLSSHDDDDDASTSDAGSSSEEEDAVKNADGTQVSAPVSNETFPQGKLSDFNSDETSSKDVLSTDPVSPAPVGEPTDESSPNGMLSTDPAYATPIGKSTDESSSIDNLSTDSVSATPVIEPTADSIPNEFLSLGSNLTDILSTNLSCTTAIGKLTDEVSTNIDQDQSDILSANPLTGKMVDETNPKERRPSLGLVDYSSSDENSDNDDVELCSVSADEQTDTADVFQTLPGIDIERNVNEESAPDMTTKINEIVSCVQGIEDSLCQDTSVGPIKEFNIHSLHVDNQLSNAENITDVKALVEKDLSVATDLMSNSPRNNLSSCVEIVQNCEDVCSSACNTISSLQTLRSQDTTVDVLISGDEDSSHGKNSVKRTTDATNRELNINSEIKVDCTVMLNDVAQAEVYAYPYVDEVKLLSPFFFNSDGSECHDQTKKQQDSPVVENNKALLQKTPSIENTISLKFEDSEDPLTTAPGSVALKFAAETISSKSCVKQISTDSKNIEETSCYVLITDVPSTPVMDIDIAHLATFSDEVVLVTESNADKEITVQKSLDHCCDSEPSTLVSVDHKNIDTSNDQTWAEIPEVIDTKTVASDLKIDEVNLNLLGDKYEVIIEKETLIVLGDEMNKSRPYSETEQCIQISENNDSLGHSSRNIFSDFKTEFLSEKVKKETEYVDKNPSVIENDDADDLSDFDLVIEEDKSSRNIVPYKTAAAEKRTHVSKASSKASDSKAPGAKMSRKESAKPFSNALSTSKEQVKKEERLTRDLIPRKPLSGARSLKKASQEQFVWDMDDEDDAKHLKNFISKNERTRTPSTANEVLKRKKNALREKSEILPFTWDLDDGCTEKSTHINQENKLALSVSESQDDRTRTKSRRIIRKKRNLSPDFVSGTFISSKSKVPAKKEKKVNMKEDRLLLMNNESPLGMLESSSNSITVDEEISFKRDSFSSPFLSNDSCSASSSLTSSPSNNWRRRRRSQKLSRDATPSSSPSAVKHLKINLEQALPNSLLALRIRHSSLDSNKSESSQVLKRHGETTAHSPGKKIKKSCDPLKAGLIKITPPASQSIQDGPAPSTRSSDAAVKALNQKNLRNRGVNPSDVRCLSSSKNLAPQNNNMKVTSDSVLGGKYLNMSSRFSSVKSSPSEKTAKMLNNSPPTEKAVVKRRNPSAPPIPSRKPRLKTGTMTKGNGSVSSSTAVFLVDPVPQSPRGGLKSTFNIPPAGTKTIHTQLPPGAPLKSQNALVSCVSVLSTEIFILLHSRACVIIFLCSKG
ncbi:hypothetical protein Btru_043656 [Bulinus truncatus]|nr:hypothetical protein Btru_043656 [Bulinus truncatus]